MSGKGVNLDCGKVRVSGSLRYATGRESWAERAGNKQSVAVVSHDTFKERNVSIVRHHRIPMTTRIRQIVVSLLVIAVSVVAIKFSRPVPNAIAAIETLQAGGPLKWYRGNMHTHSHWSDGDDYLEMIALWYRDHQYDFLVFTDQTSWRTRNAGSKSTKRKADERRLTS